MFEFDLQRFAEEAAEPNSEPETSTEEQEPIPEELGGLPEDLARETMAEWAQSQAESEPQSELEPQSEPEPPKPPTEESVPYARFKKKVDEANQLKAQLAEYQRQLQQQQPPQPQQPQTPQLKITPENSAKISEAITAEAMALTGKKI